VNEDNDLHLHYKFTDRGGKLVYGLFRAADRMCLKEELSEIRLDPDESNLRPKSGVEGGGTG
jgi:hypothetical protein